MNETRVKGWGIAAIPIISVLLFAWYQSINSTYPYYFIWDMDHTVALDTLLIESEKLPDHINHTGFGMYLVLDKTVRLGQMAGAVSVASLSDVRESLNPILTTAELTGFIRAHQPFLIFVIGLLLSLSLSLLSGFDSRIMALGLALIGTCESFSYHAALIRTESYSVFFWACSILALSAAARPGRAIRAALLFTAGGVMLGLSFITKVQALFYVVTTGLMVLFFYSPVRDSGQDLKEPWPPKSLWPILAGFFNWSFYLILTLAAWRQEIPSGILTWSENFGITSLWILFFAAFLALFIWQAALRISDISGDWYRKGEALNYIAFGFMLSFFLHFAVFAETNLGWHYLLLDFKMMFLRNTSLISIKDLSGCMREFFLYVRYNPAMFAGLLAVHAVAAFCCLRARKKRSALLFMLLITALLLLNITIGTRFILRDILWKETIIYFWILVISTYIIKNSAGTGSRIAVFFIFFVLLLSNIRHCLLMPERINANYNIYGWEQNSFLREVYGGNQKYFTGIISDAYTGTMIEQAKLQAENYDSIKSIVDFVFAYPTGSLRHVGVVQKGAVFSSAKPSWHLEYVPEELRGAILVDSGINSGSGKFTLKEEYVREESEYLDKFENCCQIKSVSALGRSDLAVYLFAPEKDINDIVQKDLSSIPWKISALRGSEEIQFAGAEIKNYAIIPHEKLNGSYFFVLKKINTPQR